MFSKLYNHVNGGKQELGRYPIVGALTDVILTVLAMAYLLIGFRHIWILLFRLIKPCLMKWPQHSAFQL